MNIPGMELDEQLAMANRDIDRNGFEVLPGVVPRVAVTELRALAARPLSPLRSRGHAAEAPKLPGSRGQSDSQLVSPVAHASPQESNATAAVRQSVRRSSPLSARSPTGAATTPTRQQKKASITPYCASS